MFKERKQPIAPEPKKHIGLSGSLCVIIFFLAIGVFVPVSVSAYYEIGFDVDVNYYGTWSFFPTYLVG